MEVRESDAGNFGFWRVGFFVLLITW